MTDPLQEARDLESCIHSAFVHMENANTALGARRHIELSAAVRECVAALSLIGAKLAASAGDSRAALAEAGELPEMGECPKCGGSGQMNMSAPYVKAGACCDCLAGRKLAAALFGPTPIKARVTPEMLDAKSGADAGGKGDGPTDSELERAYYSRSDIGWEPLKRRLRAVADLAIQWERARPSTPEPDFVVVHEAWRVPIEPTPPPPEPASEGPVVSKTEIAGEASDEELDRIVYETPGATGDHGYEERRNRALYLRGLRDGERKRGELESELAEARAVVEAWTQWADCVTLMSAPAAECPIIRPDKRAVDALPPDARPKP